MHRVSEVIHARHGHDLLHLGQIPSIRLGLPFGIVIAIFSLGVFVFISIMNPQTLIWVGLVQLDCNLPEHHKCIAEHPQKMLFGGN